MSQKATAYGRYQAGASNMSRRGFLLGMATVGAGAVMATLFGCAQSSGSSSSASSSSASTGDYTSLKLDMAAWNYDSDNDVYYQIGVPYCTAPVAVDYESMGIYVPGAYFTGTENSDGTYTCSVNASGSVGGYTAETAPMVLPINTAGYSAQKAPTEYSSNGVTDYLSAGFVYVYAGCRGRANGDGWAGGAPWGVTDLKAAVRTLRLNDSDLPGSCDRIFTFGHSGGGAQSALMGATGDAPEYEPYLQGIGAPVGMFEGTKLSDAVAGAMCWCPITNLDYADEAYEWNMGQFASSGTRADGTFTAELSKDMAKEWASYINNLGLHDESGNTLSLEESSDGIYTAGSYYDYVKAVIEGSLNNFLSDTTFPYTPSNSTMADMGAGGGATGGMEGGHSGDASGELSSGEAPGDFGDTASGAPSGAPDGASADNPSSSFNSDASSSSGAPAGTPDSTSGGIQGMPGDSSDGSSSSSTTYETVEDYIAALNEDVDWIAYDSSTNTAAITGIAAFAQVCKAPTKDVGAFDMLDRSAAENDLFGNAETDSLHFDQTMADLLQTNSPTYSGLSNWSDSYPSDYASDLQETDDLGGTITERQNMYNPLYYLAPAYEGCGTSTPAPHWRIRTGIEQGDTANTTEINLALAAQAADGVSDVDFETVWGLGHTTAERTGSSTSNFIAWVQECSSTGEAVG